MKLQMKELRQRFVPPEAWLRGVALKDGGGETESWSGKRKEKGEETMERQRSEPFDAQRMRLEFWLSSSSSNLLSFPSQSTNNGARIDL